MFTTKIFKKNVFGYLTLADLYYTGYLTEVCLKITINSQ